MGSIWLLSGADKPPARPRKPAAKRPARRPAGAKSRPTGGRRRSADEGPAEEPKPKPKPQAPTRRATNTYQTEITLLANRTAALAPDFRDAVVRLVQGAIDLFKRGWRALHGGRPAAPPADEPPPPPGDGSA